LSETVRAGTGTPRLRVARTLVVIVIPWGLLLAFLTSSHSPVSWPDFALTALLAVIIFGAALTAVTHLFVRHVRRSAWSIAAFFLAMLVTGLLAAIAIYFSANSVPHGKWTRLPDLPERGVSFAGPQCYTDGEVVIYVRTATGQIYSYGRALESVTGPWILVADVPSGVVRHLPTCDLGPLTQTRAPWLAGSSLATYEVEMRGADCQSHVHFVLRQDHSVWTWSRSSCVLGEISFVLVLAALAAVESLLAALAVVLLRAPAGWQRQSRSAPDATAADPSPHS
jgi:hypothetical protein